MGTKIKPRIFNTYIYTMASKIFYHEIVQQNINIDKYEPKPSNSSFTIIYFDIALRVTL